MPDADRYDFFVSYSSHDNLKGQTTNFVDGILAEHRAFSGGRELTYFFDRKEIWHGHDWQHTLHHGIAESRVFLAFISPNYFSSEWCCREWRAWIDTEIAKHVFSNGASPIYFIHVPGFDDHALPESKVCEEIAKLCGIARPYAAFAEDASPVIHQLRRRQFVYAFDKEGKEALRREDLRRVLENLAKDLDERSQRVRQAAESANTVPPYNKKFTGRVKELLDLRERLKSDLTGVVCGLQGLGGIGKTELAYAYAHAFAGVYPGGRFEVPCDGKATIQQAALTLGDFADFRAAITDEERKTPDGLFAAIMACLERRLEQKGSILLVLDNVTAADLMTQQGTDPLTKLGPKLHLLMTTRLAAPPGGNWLTLGELPEADALALLEKHRAFADAAEREAGQRIVRRLGGFAMAVELVAAWLAVHQGSNYQTLSETIGLEDLEAISSDGMSAELRRHNHERRMTAVLGPILGTLLEVERRTLEMAAYLPPDYVALPWLKALMEADAPQALAPRRLIADPWTEICSSLLRLALFSRADDDAQKGESLPRRVRVHRLLQDVVKQAMSSERRTECQRAVEKLARARDAELRKETRWESARWELEPVEALAYLWAEAKHESAAWLLYQAGERWHNVAEWKRAEPPMRRALEIDEASYGKDHPEVATELNNLAELLHATKRLSEAEPLMRRALEINEASYGKDHPEVAINLNNLALLLQETNRLSEAEPLMRRALEIDEASYGKNHPDVAIRLNNLAQSLLATNRLSEAEPLMRRALKIDEASFGRDHPNVANNLSNLAQLLQDTNRLSDAEPLKRRALEIDEASYGKDHPKVAIRLNNLAGLLLATNRLSEAEPLMRRALKIDEASYGKDHPNVAIQLNNLAQLLQDTNRLSEAEPLMRRALEIFLRFSRNTVHEHPTLRTAVVNYDALLDAMKLPPPEVFKKLNSLGPEPLAILKKAMDQANE